jgi:hypothetical protein
MDTKGSSMEHGMEPRADRPAIGFRLSSFTGTDYCASPAKIAPPINLDEGDAQDNEPDWYAH